MEEEKKYICRQATNFRVAGSFAMILLMYDNFKIKSGISLIALIRIGF